MNDQQHPYDLTEAKLNATAHNIRDMSSELASMPDGVFHDQMRAFIELQKTKSRNRSLKKSGSCRFKEIFDNGNELKLQPFRIKPPEFKEYPEIKKIASGVTADDLIDIAKDFSAMEGSLYMRMVYDIMRTSDKACFDCFREYLGCKTADDVFKIMTTESMYHLYNEIVPLINQRIGEYLNLTGIGFLGFCETDKPADDSKESLDRLRARWEEIYNENAATAESEEGKA